MAIIPGGNWSARFKFEREGRTDLDTEPVVLWREFEDGDVVGYILNDRHRLASAEKFSNFDGYEQADGPSTVVAAPAGWWAVCKEGSGGAWWQRVLAWAVEDGGYSPKAITTPTSTGYSEPVEASERCRFVYAPERTEAGVGEWPDYDGDSP